MTEPLLHYQFEFQPHELEAIKECKEKHGFAIVKQMLSPEHNEQLKDEVRRLLGPNLTSEAVLSYTDIAFIENSPVMAQLMTYEPLMKIAEYINDNNPLTLNRSAAIYKKPGSAGNNANSGIHAWHTDWAVLEHPYNANAVLNNTGATSMWFYLTGSNPHNGGLAIIPDSHLDDWAGPEAYAFTADRRSFYREGTEPVPCIEMDVPGMIPVITEPGDLVIFAEKTYHGVNTHQGNEARLSCGFSFRDRNYDVGDIWPLQQSSLQFIDSCSVEIKPLVEGYIGIDTSWVSNPS